MIDYCDFVQDRQPERGSRKNNQLPIINSQFGGLSGFYTSGRLFDKDPRRGRRRHARRILPPTGSISPNAGYQASRNGCPHFCCIGANSSATGT